MFNKILNLSNRNTAGLSKYDLVKVYSQLADPTLFQLVGIEVDLVFPLSQQQQNMFGPKHFCIQNFLDLRCFWIQNFEQD